MNKDFAKKAILKRLQRNFGQSDAVRMHVREQNAIKTDWFGHCRKCGVRLEGTLAELKGHTCGT